MSEVMRFWAEEAQGIRCVRESDYDHALAREAALQQLLNEKDQRLDELQQRLAEAEKMVGQGSDLLRRAQLMVPALQYNWHANTKALLAIPASPDDACAHSHANRLGCPECGEEFSGDEVKP